MADNIAQKQLIFKERDLLFTGFVTAASFLETWLSLHMVYYENESHIWVKEQWEHGNISLRVK